MFECKAERNPVAVFDLSISMLEGLANTPLAIEPFADLWSALDCVRSENCSILVLGQPKGWSLDRTAREIRPVCGDDRAIVLSPLGSSFAPGIYVLSDQVSAEALGRLIGRIAQASSNPHRPSRAQAVALSEDSPGVTGGGYFV